MAPRKAQNHICPYERGWGEGCPVLRDKEGWIYLEVRPGKYWRLTWAVYDAFETEEDREEAEQQYRRQFEDPDWEESRVRP